MSKKNRFPIFYENSRIPVWLSYVSPIEIGAISLALFVFSRGEMSEETKQHEAIHYHQWRELGFLLFPLLYGFYYLLNYIRYRDGSLAYMSIPFEQEAYGAQDLEGYLDDRPFMAWLNYR